MRRKLEEAQGPSSAASLKEMMTVIDHLSPTVRIDQGRAQPWTAIRIMTGGICIQWIAGGREWSSTVAKLRRAVSRYQSRIDDIQLAFSLPSASMRTLTMEDGTCITGVPGECESGGYILSYVSLLTPNTMWYPTDFVHQVYTGSVERVKSMVESGVDINARTGATDKDTALGISVLGMVDDDVLMTQYLTSLPDIDVEDTDWHGNTLLLRVIGKIAPHRLDSLLRGGVNVHAQNKFGQNVLHELAQTCSHNGRSGEKVMMLLLHGSGTLMMCVDNEGCLPFPRVTQWQDEAWAAHMNLANNLKMTTMRDLADIISFLVPVSALVALILGYLTL